MTTAPGPERRRGRGPRGAGADTRGDILVAAAAGFSEHGYAGTSMRAIARAAGVDPALVRHYFDSKAELFIAAMRPAQPDDARLLALVSAPRDQVGTRLIALFLELWDDPSLGPRMRGILLSAMTTPEVASAVQTVLIRDVVLRLARDDHKEMRAGAAASQLMGLAAARYLIGVPAVVQASRAELVAVYGPTLQRYLQGELDLEG
ncbi:TetR family transcriptional regulator [Demequina sp.]|uniref:TetR/AcrR family transcriptional regulator n=1 Tax=Demequina sp. TaxID=2050685 RepID=UPI0025DD6C91|nr:TetR family transcriptional regulator [Demequina sp.]